MTTTLRVLIKYSPNTKEVSDEVIDRVDIWRKASEPAGRAKLTLTGEHWGDFSPDDPIQIRLNDIVVFEGNIDSGRPVGSSTDKSYYEQTFEIEARDYGQELLNRYVNKSAAWFYDYQYADDIIEDMVYNSNADLYFTSSTGHLYGGIAISQMAYTDDGDETLADAIGKILSKCNFDYYVDEDKTLVIFRTGSISSSMNLQCVEGSASNNLLDLHRIEYDTTEVKNYIIARRESIEDGWTDGNASDWTGSTGNVITDDYADAIKGTASIKCNTGSGNQWPAKAVLEFPKYNYTYLPLNEFCEGSFGFSYKLKDNLITTNTGFLPPIFIELTDTSGSKIVWRNSGKATSIWYKASIPVGMDILINDLYNSWYNTVHQDVYNGWQYENGSNFTWKIKRMEISAPYLLGAHVPGFWIDGMDIKIPMVAYAQDAASQAAYRVRKQIVNARNVRTQVELQDLANSELAKLKDPIGGMQLTALGTAGLTTSNKWIPGYTFGVNDSGEGIDADTNYRMQEIHLIKTDGDISGHDFVAEIMGVDQYAPTKGSTRTGNLTDPNTTILRELSERIRFFEKEKNEVFDYLPPMPADAAEKIRIGEFSTLADSTVNFTRKWEAELGSGSEYYTVYSDASGSNGKSMKLLLNEDSLGAAWYFHDGFVDNSGEFYFLLRSKVQTGSRPTPTGNYTFVIKSKTSGTNLASLAISPDMFPSQKYHHFALRCEIPQNDTNLQIYVSNALQGDLTYLQLDYVAMLPADLPLGYADVSIASTNPGTTGDNVDPGTTGDNVNPGATGDNVDPGTTAVQADSENDTILNLGFSASEQKHCLPGEWTTIRSGYCDTGSDSTELALIDYRIGCYTGSGYAIVSCGTVETDTTDVRLMYFRDTDAGELFCTFLTPFNLSGSQALVEVYPITNALDLRGFLRVYQYKKHTHDVTGDAHSTTISGDSHTTPVSGDAHTTPISGDEHTHTNSDYGHEH